MGRELGGGENGERARGDGGVGGGGSWGRELRGGRGSGES